MPVAEQCCRCQHCIALFAMPPGNVSGIQMGSLDLSFRYHPHLTQAKGNICQGGQNGTRHWGYSITDEAIKHMTWLCRAACSPACTSSLQLAAKLASACPRRLQRMHDTYTFPAFRCNWLLFKTSHTCKSSLTRHEWQELYAQHCCTSGQYQQRLHAHGITYLSGSRQLCTITYELHKAGSEV